MEFVIPFCHSEPSLQFAMGLAKSVFRLAYTEPLVSGIGCRVYQQVSRKEHS